MFTALLDTCVLWPSLQRDFLLSLATEGLYRPVWSAAILAELEEHETRKLIKRGEQAPQARSRARLLIDRMSSAFDDAEAQGWEGLEGTYGLPDPDDEHIVAAAMVTGAGAIVTHNTKDFPPAKLPSGLATILPARFAANTVALYPLGALTAIDTIVERSGARGPKRTQDEIFTVLAERYRMTDAVEIMREARK
ncbi:PIN domain-containing protein [Actinomadura pelletieri DSM 43383]|uniref:PIN domain-containing protein n=1 Tax=Actinomadura pelletieri DSM 43383 TaxID=1120940 RepID=A0A495R0F4_9ACTN|nr:PIN domain-containing protein [Actinomadura pelletieri]RKS79694.1 PIN domain-containing protein [Actinomadura pelletieri DSM 43383]